MRLLKLEDNSKFSLTKFIDKPLLYTILSHTQGEDNEEVIFKDVVGGTGKSKNGYVKIHFYKNQAAKDGL